MKPFLWRSALWFALAAVVSSGLAQRGGGRGDGPLAGNQNTDQNEGVRLPNGKLQRAEILKAEYEQNLKDAARLVELAEALQQELEKNDRFVLSISSVKKTDDIEKLVKKIRSRLRRN